MEERKDKLRYYDKLRIIVILFRPGNYGKELIPNLYSKVSKNVMNNNSILKE